MSFLDALCMLFAPNREFRDAALAIVGMQSTMVTGALEKIK
jgi:hypothetical protein